MYPELFLGSEFLGISRIFNDKNIVRIFTLTVHQKGFLMLSKSKNDSLTTICYKVLSLIAKKCSLISRKTLNKQTNKSKPSLCSKRLLFFKFIHCFRFTPRSHFPLELSLMLVYYCLCVLKTRTSELRYWQGHSLSEGLLKDSFLASS